MGDMCGYGRYVGMGCGLGMGDSVLLDSNRNDTITSIVCDGHVMVQCGVWCVRMCVFVYSFNRHTYITTRKFKISFTPTKQHNLFVAFQMIL